MAGSPLPCPLEPLPPPCVSPSTPRVAAGPGEAKRQGLPSGLAMTGQAHPSPEPLFLRDLTFVDSTGQRQSEQQIFDAAFSLIADARNLVVADVFFFNEFPGKDTAELRPLARQLTAALLAARRAHPALTAILITDPINALYGGTVAPLLDELQRGGVTVVITRLERLRDSNPLYSWLWRLLFRPFGNGPGGTALPNPLGAGRVSLRSYLAMLNFKGNHRKVLIADRDGLMVGLVTSANPHGASSAHTNVGLCFTGPAVQDLLRAEMAVAAFSGTALPASLPFMARAAPLEADGVTLQVLTESGIKRRVLGCLGNAGPDDDVDLVIFYLADRDIVRALVETHRRGARLRLVLDPNKDAFGYAKSGVPNRQVARELVAAGIAVRWYDTHGEQCHAKMLLVRRGAGESTLILGSANLTRRNLNDFNLEADIAVQGPADRRVFRDALAFVDDIWGNRDSRQCTLPYAAYRDDAWVRQLRYRFQEATGMGTF